jgi:hypothetical protein
VGRVRIRRADAAAACPAWGGRQYLSIAARADGTSIDAAALVER